jgi:[ribosomal protein S18]-alanine N-acetyltransferase
MTGNAQTAIRPMTEEDLDRVLTIESASFPLPWTRNHFLDELKSPHSFPLVAYDETDGVIGYACAVLVVDEAELLDVAVDPRFRQRGIGRRLVDEVVRTAREAGAAFVALEVRRSNDSAIRLYRDMGFRETGIRKKYYENGEDALLMEYRLEGEGREVPCSSSPS